MDRLRVRAEVKLHSRARGVRAHECHAKEGCGAGAREKSARGTRVQRGRVRGETGIKGGPREGGEEELSVGNLPEQKVGDALFAAGAHDEVRVRDAGGGQTVGDGLLVDVVETKRAARVVERGAARSFHEVLPPAVAEADREQPARASMLCCRLHGFCRRPQSRWEGGNVASNFDADVVLLYVGGAPQFVQPRGD